MTDRIMRLLEAELERTMLHLIKAKQEVQVMQDKLEKYQTALQKIESFQPTEFMGPSSMALECVLVARRALEGKE